MVLKNISKQYKINDVSLQGCQKMLIDINFKI